MSESYEHIPFITFNLFLVGVEHSKLVGLAEKHFGGLDAEPKYKDELRTNVPYCRFTGSDVSWTCFLSIFCFSRQYREGI